MGNTDLLFPRIIPAVSLISQGHELQEPSLKSGFILGD